MQSSWVYIGATSPVRFPLDLTEALKSTDGVVGDLDVKKMGSAYRVELGAGVNREIDPVHPVVKEHHGVVVP
ncbi:hypothetical protein [Methanopyrus sp.]